MSTTTTPTASVTTPTPAARAHRRASAAMLAAGTFATAGFTELGAIFDYPTILKQPTTVILTAYRQHQAGVTAGFLALIAAAALLAPIAVLLARSVDGSVRGWIAGLGVAAAVVQVVGLSRWVLFVPALSDDALDPAGADAATHRFELLHTWLGEVVGETLGYALTAAFTVVVARAIGRALAPRWVTLLGYVAAGLIATGTVIPLGLGLASSTNFVGYIAWTLWLVVMAVVLWRAAPVASRS